MTDFQQVYEQVETLVGQVLQPPLELDRNLSRVFQLAWWASDDSRPAVLVEVAGDPPAIDWSRSMARTEQDGSTLRVGIADSGARWEHLQVLDRVSALLAALPDGSELELLISGTHPIRTRGAVRGGRWHLSSFFPAMPRAVLERALELSRQAQEGEDLCAASPEIAEAAEETFRAEWSLAPDREPKLEREGERIRAVSQDGDNSWHRLLAGHLLVHDPELCQAFALEEKLRQLSEGGAQASSLHALTAQLSQGIGRALGIPQGPLLLEGKRGIYRGSDIRQLAWIRPGEVETSDDELRPLGFSPLGDLTTDAVVMRLYGCDERDCWAVVTATHDRMYLRELYSRCEGGECLTTASMPYGDEKPDRKLFKQSLPDCDFGQLLARHRSHLQERGWKPLECPQDLPGTAHWIDDYLLAWHG